MPFTPQEPPPPPRRRMAARSWRRRTGQKAAAAAAAAAAWWARRARFSPWGSQVRQVGLGHDGQRQPLLIFIFIFFKFSTRDLPPVLLSGAIQLTGYPPNAFAPVSVRDEYMKEAGGNFVQLSRGKTHYELHEPPEGEAAEGLPPVVLLHGVISGWMARVHVVGIS